MDQKSPDTIWYVIGLFVCLTILFCFFRLVNAETSYITPFGGNRDYTEGYESRTWENPKPPQAPAPNLYRPYKNPCD